MIVLQPVDVTRLIEHTLAFHLNVARVVLTEALKTWTSDRYGVSAPIGRGEFAQPIAARTNSTVYDSVGDEVERVPSPRPIHAREEQVTIHSRAEALFLIYCSHHRIDPKSLRRCALT